jgi:hypothetical protein
MGNGIGKFMDVGEYFYSKVNRRVVRIFVEIDLFKGLLDELEISCGN